MVSRHITRHSMSGLEAKPLISSTACLSFPPIPSASMQIRTRKNSPICYSLDKTDVGVFLYGPVVDRIESVRIDGKLVSSVFIVIQTAYMTCEVLYVFRLKKLYGILLEIPRDHFSSSNDRRNSTRDIFQKLRRKNAICEDVTPVGNNTDMDRSNEF